MAYLLHRLDNFLDFILALEAISHRDVQTVKHGVAEVRRAHVLGVALSRVAQRLELRLQGRLFKPFKVAQERVNFRTVSQMKVLLLLHSKKLNGISRACLPALCTDMQRIKFRKVLFQSLILVTYQHEQVVKQLQERLLVFHHMQTCVRAYQKESQVLQDVPLVQARVVLDQVIDEHEKLLSLAQRALLFVVKQVQPLQQV